MELRISQRQGQKLLRATESFRKAQSRYSAAISRAVPELARYRGYHGEIQFFWEVPSVPLESIDLKAGSGDKPLG